MNQVCVEDCAIERDCSQFELKPWYRLEDLPRYPVEDINEMTKQEKFTSVVVYLTKVVDHLQGADDEREDLYRSRSGGALEALRKQCIQARPEGQDSPHTDRAEHQVQREPARTVAR